MVKVVITDKTISDTGDDLIINFEFTYGGVKYKSGISIPISILSQKTQDEQLKYIVEEVRGAANRIIRESLLKPTLDNIPSEVEA